MTSGIWFYIEVNILLAFFYVVFLLIKQRIPLKWARITLILLPLIAFCVIVLKRIVDLSEYSYVPGIIQLNPVQVSSVYEVNGFWPNLNFWSIYGVVTVILFVIFLMRLIRLIHLFRTHKSTTSGGLRCYSIPNQTSFSFFNNIQIESGLSDDEKMLVFEHEKEHARQLHSLDIILLELYHIFLWVNPILFLMKRSLVFMHEYQVDQVLYRNYRVKYLRFLVNYALGFSSPNYLLTSRFKKQLAVKKRIQIMKTQKKSKKWLFIFLPIVAFGSMFMQCTKSIEPKSSDPIEQNENSIPLLDKNNVYEVVDESPIFKGGQEGMSAFIVENVTYPKELVDEGVEGNVFVEFIVNADGRIENPLIKRGVHPELDAEALRVVSLMPDWTPGKLDGKDVAVKFVLPISFRLN
ncbi:M56 family metallopeptidase [Crocinitomix algicola]|uniref:M56 family metallopeptidase n=1 Tax=Crocinitomix algicola TaxID=1740263 RepID=UPI000831C09E|nr:M56 family metallopeptidase [Crocinitomix algicola]